MKAYFYRFHITCPCTGGDQTVDHLLLDCTDYYKERNELRNSVISKGGEWSQEKSISIKTFLKDFCKYVKTTDFTKKTNVLYIVYILV